MSKITPWDLCKQCGYAFNRAASVKGSSGPKPGNVSLCLNCGHATIFTEDMHRREIDPKEFVTFPDWVKAMVFTAMGSCSRARGIDLAARQRNLAH